MKNFFSFAVLFAIATTFNAHAKDVLGNIVRVVPVYSERQVPQQVCEFVSANQGPGGQSGVNAGTVIGGIAGALWGLRCSGTENRVKENL